MEASFGGDVAQYEPEVNEALAQLRNDLVETHTQIASVSRELEEVRAAVEETDGEVDSIDSKLEKLAHAAAKLMQQVLHTGSSHRHHRHHHHHHHHHHSHHGHNHDGTEVASAAGAQPSADGSDTQSSSANGHNHHHSHHHGNHHHHHHDEKDLVYIARHVLDEVHTTCSWPPHITCLVAMHTLMSVLLLARRLWKLTEGWNTSSSSTMAASMAITRATVWAIACEASFVTSLLTLMVCSCGRR